MANNGAFPSSDMSSIVFQIGGTPTALDQHDDAAFNTTNGQELCAGCSSVGKHTCGGCYGIKYCSHKCQRAN